MVKNEISRTWIQKNVLQIGCLAISVEGLPEIQWALIGLAFK